MINYLVDIYQNHYMNFEGRTARAPHNYFAGLFILISVLFGYLRPEEVNSENFTFALILGITSLIIGLGSLLPGLGVSIRRNHDLNLSGWFILLGLIPFVNIAYVIYIFVARGTVGPNNYGEDPTDAPLGYAGPKLPTSVSQINSTQVNQ